MDKGDDDGEINVNGNVQRYESSHISDMVSNTMTNTNVPVTLS